MRRAPARRGRRGNPWLAIAGYAGLGIGCLVLVAVTFLIVAAPVDLVRDRLVAEVKARTGRDLAVAGPISLVLFPRVAVAFSDVALSAPPEMGGGPMATVGTLEAEVGVVSLLSRQASIKRVVLTRPVLELRVDGQGRRSWDFAAAEPRPVRLAQATSRGDDGTRLAQAQVGRRAADGARLADMLDQLSLSSVRVADGTVRYNDERAGLRYEVGALDLDIALAGASGPLELKGSLGWRGEKVAFEGALSPLRAVLDDERARLTLKLAGQTLQAAYDGALGLASGPALDGNLSLNAGSVQGLAAWLGKPIAAAGRDPGALSLTAAVKSTDGRVSLANLSGNLGDTSLAGALAIETKGARPHVGGNLRLSQLDLGRILIRPAPSAAAGPGQPPGPAPAVRRPPESARDAPAPAVPQVRGFSKRAGGGPDWSENLIDLAPLGLADADLALSAERLLYKDVKAGPARLSLQLKDRVAKLTLQDMQLYGGRGRGVVTLDGGAQVPATTINLTLDRVSVLPLLKDAMGFEWLEGQGSIGIALAGQGVSERQFVESLNGKADLTTANGAINGFDIGKVLGGIEQGRLSGLGASSGDKTPFSEFAGSFAITNGVASNQDLRLVSPRLRVTGQGTIDLAQRQLDYTVNPKIVGGVTVPGAVINVKNLEIPVRVEGPWEKPTFSIKGQEQVLDAVKKIKPQDVEDAIKGLLGGTDGQRVKPRELLDKLFKKD